MADFCKECSVDNFGKDFGDLAGIVDPGCFVWVICEGCTDKVGFLVLVDHDGVRRKDLEIAWADGLDER